MGESVYGVRRRKRSLFTFPTASLIAASALGGLLLGIVFTLLVAGLAMVLTSIDRFLMLRHPRAWRIYRIATRTFFTVVFILLLLGIVNTILDMISMLR
ncbi:MAG: hypothetical protein QXI45_02445 [Thermofilaceae archaeon]